MLIVTVPQRIRTSRILHRAVTSHHRTVNTYLYKHQNNTVHNPQAISNFLIR